MAKFFDFSVDDEDGNRSNTLVFNTLGNRITEKIYEQIKNVRNGVLFTREPSQDNTEPQKTFMPYDMQPDAFGSNGKHVFEEFNKFNERDGYDFSRLDPGVKELASSEGELSMIDANLRRSLSLKPGESPVVNPNWQWGELDDVRSNPHSPLVGRVFLNDIMANYPLIIVEPGREKFNRNPFSFFGIGTEASIANATNDYIRNGGEPSIGNMFKSFVALVTNVVFLPFTILRGAWRFLFGGEETGKFIRFKSAMKLYSRMVNDVWNEVAGNLGLMPLELQNTTLAPGDTIKIPKPEITETGEVLYDDAYLEGEYERYKKNSNIPYDDLEIYNYENKETTLEDQLFQKFDEESLQKNASVKKRGKLLGYKGTWEYLDLQSILPNNVYGDKDKTGKISNFFLNAATKIYVPWLCTKSVSVTESFSNNTEEHPIAGIMNNIAQESKTEFGALGEGIKIVGESGLDFNDIVTKATKSISKYLGGEAVSSIAEMGLLINGKGRALFPQVWSSSSYSRSITFNFKFFAPYGDTTTIFENVLAQYLMWMVLSMPIQTAKNVYTSPFVVRAYSKGLFSCEFGMVESLSVKRGEEKNDKNVVGLPRTISVDIGLKDLAPVMMMSLGGGLLWKFRAANTALSEYLAMICGMTVADRNMTLNKLKRLANKVLGGVTEELLNPHFWARKASDSIIGLPFRWWANTTGKIRTERSVQYPGIGQ